MEEIKEERKEARKEGRREGREEEQKGGGKIRMSHFVSNFSWFQE